MRAKYDAQIIELFNQGHGARSIAKKLGIEYPATISKRLIKMGLKQEKTNATEISTGILDIKFRRDEHYLHQAAEDYLKFICRFSGYPFFVPSNDTSFDLLVQFGDLKKVQVKSSYCKAPSGNYSFSLIRTRNNSNGSREVPYTKDDTDFFFLMDIEMNCWLIPFDVIGHKTGVTPQLICPGYKII